MEKVWNRKKRLACLAYGNTRCGSAPWPEIGLAALLPESPGPLELPLISGCSIADTVAVVVNSTPAKHLR